MPDVVTRLPLVACVVGTRPEAIKMAPVIRELRRKPDQVRTVVVSTGQHREMLAQAFGIFGLRPDVELNVMQPNQTLAGLTAALLAGLDGTFAQLKPDWVVAQGDTTTVLVAALVAFYQRIKFGHVEAGLRSGDKLRPYPEEVNRRMADVVADAYFAPTALAEETLLREGAPRDAVFRTGNTVVDALFDVAERPFDWAGSPVRQPAPNERLVLVTAHRRESFGGPFLELCTAIRELAVAYQQAGVSFVYPVHLNPNVRDPVNRILAGLPNVHLIEPVDYVTMVHLMKSAALVLTDSGGIQEEAPSFGVPVLVMRDTTERPEGVTAGVAQLVGTRRDRIVAASRAVLDAQSTDTRRRAANPYGDGHAAERIVRVLLETAP